jgi:hypothetical protein
MSQLNPNNASYFHDVNANAAVREVTFHFASFDTEMANDRLQIGVLPPINMSGPLGAMNQAVEDDGGRQAPEAWRATFNFVTDSGMPSGGFEIDSATVTKCDAVPAGFPQQPALELGDGTMGAGRRTIGMLLHTGDTLFYSYRSNARNAVPANFKLHAALNSQVFGVDFNLYAKCGAYPTASNFDFAGTSQGGQEFLEFDTGPCPTTWYFAVDSARDGGEFELSIATGSDVAVCASFTGPALSRAQKDIARDTLTGAVRAVYGSTAGSVLVSRIQVTDDGNCDASILPQAYRFLNAHIHTDCGRSITTNPTKGGGPTFTDLCNDWLTTTGVLAAYIANHELGHQIWGLPDEYTDTAGAGCGHSQMAVADDTFFSLCTAFTHRLDPIAGAVYRDPGDMSGASTGPFGDGVSMWQKLGFNAFGPPVDFPRMQQVDTPDNYNYLDFDFNSSAPGTVQTITSYQ